MQTRRTFARYWVLAALCTAAVLAYIHRGCLAVPRGSIEQDLAMTERQMTHVLSAFLLGYTVFQIPGGWIAGRWGTRRALPVFLVIWSLSVGLMSEAQGFLSLYSLHLVNGMAQAGIFPCCVKSFSQWYPAAQRAFPSGMLSSFMSVGAALTTSLTGLMLRWMDWDLMLIFLALPGIVYAGFIYWWFRDSPRQHPGVGERELQWIEGASAEAPAVVPTREPVPWERIVRSRRMALICAQQFFRAAAYIFYTTQFPTFLRRTHGVSESQSGFLTSLPLLGVVGGGLTGGLIMDFIWRRTGSVALSRRGVALAGTLGGGLFLLIAYLSGNLYLSMPFIVLSTFSAGMTGPAGYTVTIDQGGKHLTTVFSVMNMAGNLGAWLYPIVIQELVLLTDWSYALFFTSFLYFAAAMCWNLLELRGGIFDESEPRKGAT